MNWLHGFLDELGKKQEMGILHSDNQSVIFLAKKFGFSFKVEAYTNKTPLYMSPC